MFMTNLPPGYKHANDWFDLGVIAAGIGLMVIIVVLDRLWKKNRQGPPDIPNYTM